MDPSAIEEETSLEVARESLIAISYSVPDTFLISTTKDSVDEVVANNGDRIDEFRSELISISYLKPPDIGHY